MIFNKKEVDSQINEEQYITINKKEVDKALNNKDFTKFKQIFESIPIGSVLYAINEKHRLEYFIKKHDLKFIDTIFSFFDSNNTLEDFHKFSDSVYIKSTDKQFAFEKNRQPIDDKQKPLYIASRNADIFKFKRKVMAKVFYYKENADGNFITQSLDLLKKHSLVDNYVIRKLASLVVQSNFESTHNQVIKHSLFNDKRIRKEYLSYVFQASTNIDNLNLIIKDFEEDIREIFFEKQDNNDFWFDFKVTREKPDEGIPYNNSFRPWIENINKLVWLEKHHMGFSHIEMPYYIDFLQLFNSDKLEQFLEKVDRNKYLDMFESSIKDYEQLPDDVLKKKHVRSLDIKSVLLMGLQHREWDSPQNFYEIIKNGTLKYDLEHTLKVNQLPKKINKL